MERRPWSDETGARILALIEENKARGPDERTGIFTTGIVARGLDSTVPPIVAVRWAQP